MGILGGGTRQTKAWRWELRGPCNKSIWLMCGRAEVGYGGGSSGRVKLKTIKLLNLILPPAIPEKSPS